MPAALALLGLIFGSFLNVCIHRLPLGRSIIAPRSACPHCAHPIRAYDNIPLLSYLLLRGRCRHCRAPISLRYPAVELATAVLFLACALAFRDPWSIAKYCCLAAILIVLFFTDLEHHLLPDAVTIPGLCLGLLFSLILYVPRIPGWMLTPHSQAQIRLLSLLHSGIGALTGAAFLFLLSEVYVRARGVRGMGLGDVKLIAFIGAFLGFRLVFFTIFAAALAGSLLGITALLLLYRRRLRRYRQPRSRISGPPFFAPADRGPRQAPRLPGWLGAKGGNPRSRAWSSAQLLLRHFPIPFGSLLAAAALLATFYGNQILHWYWNLF